MRKSLFLVVFVAAGCAVFPSGSEPPPVVTGETPPVATQAITTDPPSATPEPSTRTLVVKVTKQTASAKQNDTATITIKTKKNSRCNIDVEYESGQATAAGLGKKTADSSGTDHMEMDGRREYDPRRLADPHRLSAERSLG